MINSISTNIYVDQIRTELSGNIFAWLILVVMFVAGDSNGQGKLCVGNMLSQHSNRLS